jgi:Universal stress protein family
MAKFDEAERISKWIPNGMSRIALVSSLQLYCAQRFTSLREGSRTMKPPRLILAPVDFSELSRTALDVAADMASRFGATLLLVHIVPAIPDLPQGVSILKEGQYDSELHEAAVKQLSELAATLAKEKLNVRTEVGTANDVGMELLRIAA